MLTCKKDILGELVLRQDDEIHRHLSRTNAA